MGEKKIRMALTASETLRIERSRNLLIEASKRLELMREELLQIQAMNGQELAPVLEREGISPKDVNGTFELVPLDGDVFLEITADHEEKAPENTQEAPPE